MTEQSRDPFELTDELLLKEISQMDEQGSSTEEIVDKLEIRYGRHRMNPYRFVSAIQQLIHAAK